MIWYNNFAFFDVFRVNPEEIAIEGLPVKIEDQSIRIIVTNNQIDKLIEDLKKYKKGG